MSTSSNSEYLTGKMAVLGGLLETATLNMLTFLGFSSAYWEPGLPTTPHPQPRHSLA